MIEQSSCKLRCSKVAQRTTNCLTEYVENLAERGRLFQCILLRVLMDEMKPTAEAAKGLSSDRWSDPRVVVIVEVFRRSLSRRINITELSAAVRLSPSGLRRLFRQQMGCSIGKWQKDQRLDAARALLCTSHLSVKEVSAAVGYRDLSHFVRDFELSFGLSPRRFRRANFNPNAVLRASGPMNC